MKLAFIALAAVVSCTFAQPELDFLSDEYIEQLNSKNLPWKAGRNFERDTSLYNIQRLLSVGTINPPSEFETIFHEDDGKDLPEEFDARKQWSKCESIKEIRDQSGCGSCWGCMSYPLPRCNPSCKTLYDAPTCKKECDKGSPLKYEEDKHYAKQAYRIMSKVERQIQLEIIKNGPVVASFTVYADFIHYLSGVYKFDGESKLLGGHAVRIIGWGIENGTYPYWLVSNSWNERWGDQGLFKIWRGKNECGIEEEITAGLPR
uniref:Cathepsin B-like cysteine protease 2 n=1 Tax=Callosobruchus maculatus TaxID=64391 RepID=B2XVS9_CALMS|nr:cathepsin B-like cysteine protease 2 [Callosobruchus maculatus]